MYYVFLLSKNANVKIIEIIQYSIFECLLKIERTKTMMDIGLVQVGVLHSPYKDKKSCPLSGIEERGCGTIEIFPEYRDCLRYIENEPYIHVICWFDRSDRSIQMTHPRQDPNAPIKGVFATRCPHRPNPLSLSLFKLEKVDDLILHVRNVDVLDNTPIIDIKPYHDIYAKIK